MKIAIIGEMHPEGWETLKKNDYNSWLVVEAEQDPKKANPFEYAKKGYSYLKKTATKAGFEIIK